jgi:hypothetical protein
VGDPPALRWVGVGRTAVPDEASVAAALGDALAGRDASLLIVFASSRIDLAAALATLRSGAAGVPVVGCTTAGEIAAPAPMDGGLVVLALGGADFSFATRLATDVSGRLRAAGAEVAAALERVADRPHRLLLLLTDGLSGDQQEIVRGAYSVAGAEVPLVGGCAGDDSRMEKTHVLYGDGAHTDAVIGVAIGSSAPFGVGARHGWRRVGDPMLVTGSVGTRVLTLDDEPALDVYLRRLGAPAQLASDPEAFTSFAMTHPLGVSRRSGEEVRFIAGADVEQRALSCIAQVPQGGVTWIMEGDDASVLEATDAACADALTTLGGQPPVALLAFDCIARKGVLGAEGIAREVGRVSATAPGVPIAGFYTYGEIARTRGTGGFHNQTMVVLALA